MSESVDQPTPAALDRPIRRPKPKALSRELRHIQPLLDDARVLYLESQLCQNINRTLQTAIRASAVQPTKIVSLGLGSLTVARGQSRRIKQLALFLAIRDEVEKITSSSPDLFAQDPTFSRDDELLLSNHGVQILRTPSGSQLGDAASVIDHSTLVYSPFLTLEAYEQLLVQSGMLVQLLVGDDFNSLLKKWPKHSAERAQVDGLMKTAVSGFRRKAITGEGFWNEEDQSFPMAVYSAWPKGQAGKIEES
ncbi:hypothetical protein EJ04DRAFT_161269 [Polyplosphaeria fusca]|uniref:SRR1-like domain-containing protein n=1 Tax=Polyplosphaeria fusca TaxID=682080 RepID=A0A9P4RCK2_9PLEO|nr:hypothetical protein EJ04DRAFT_161269 [Polyplosphaeria fusca]